MKSMDKNDFKMMNMTKLLLSVLVITVGLAFAACPDRMVAYWHFDEGQGTVTHSVIGGYDGTLYGPVTWENGLINKGVDFKGGIGYSSNPPPSYIDFGTSTDLCNARTISTWVKLKNKNRDNDIMLRFNGLGTNSFYLGNAGGSGLGYGFIVSHDGSYWSVWNWTSQSYVKQDVWQNVVGVFDGTYVKLYVDGVLVGDTYDPGTIGCPSNGYTTLGAYWNGYGIYSYTQINGTIDEVAIFDRPLTQDEIIFYYNNGNGMDYCGGTPPPQPTGCPTGMVAYWKGEGNGNDQVAGNTMNLYNGNTFATYAQGKVGQAFLFGGSPNDPGGPAFYGGYGESSSPIYFSADQDATFETWFNIDSTSTAGEISLMLPLFTGDMFAPMLFAVSQGDGTYKIRCGTTLPCSWGNYVTPDSYIIQRGTWHHVALVYDAVTKNHSCYIDGALRDSKIMDTPGTHPTSRPLRIASGDEECSGSGNRWNLKGLMDEVALYNKKLTPSEVQDHYNYGLQGKDYCAAAPPEPACPTGMISYWKGDGNANDEMNANNLQWTGTPTYAAGKLGSAFDLEAGKNIYKYPVSLSLPQGSVEMWVKFDTINSFYRIAEWAGDAANYIELGEPVNNNPSQPIQFRFYDGSWHNANSGVVPVTGQWYYVVDTWDGSNMKMYINNQLKATTPYSGGFNNNKIAFGSDAATVSLDGQVDEMALYNRPLTEAEITEHYNNGLQGKDYCGETPAPPAPQFTTIYNDTGGTVTAAAGEVTIEIPAGALNTPQIQVTVEPSVHSFGTTAGQNKPIEGSQPYDFGPEGTIFVKPVTVALKGDCSNEEYFYIQQIAKFQCTSGCSGPESQQTGDWPPVVNCFPDTENPDGSWGCTADGLKAAWYYDPSGVNCKLTAETLHFSTYAVVAPIQRTSYTSFQTEGIHSLYVEAQDAAGWLATLTKLYYIDLYPPETTFTATGTTGQNGWYVSPVEVSLSASDTSLGSGVKAVYIKSGAEYSEYSSSMTVSDEGQNDIFYYSIDNAGHSEQSKVEYIKIDTLAPVTQAVLEGTLAPSGVFITEVNVTFDATDPSPGSGVTYTQYKLDDGDWTTYSDMFQITKWGNTVLQFKSEDAAGNQEDISTLIIRRDDIPPDPTVVSDPGMWSKVGEATITWLPIEDRESGTDYYNVYRCSVTIDSTCDPMTEGAVLTQTEITGYTDTGLQDGTKYMYAVTTVDNAGNEADSSNVVDIIIDMTSPLPPIIASISDNGFLNVASAVLEWTEAQDPGILASGLKQYNLYGANALFTDPSPATKSLLTVLAAGIQTYTHSGLADARTYYYQISGTDNAGNDGDMSNEQHVTIDLVAPVSSAAVISGTPGTQGWYTSEAYVEITSTDEVSKVMKLEYRATGATTTPITEYASPISIWNEGTTTIYYKATDNAGNVEAEKSITVKIDTVKPSTSSNAPTGWKNADVTVALTATDATSDIFVTRTCQYVAPATSCIPSGNAASVLVSAEGVNIIQFNSVDNAGNTENVNSAAVYLDKTAPVTTSYVTGTLESEPYSDYFMDKANVSLAATDPAPASRQMSGVASTLYCVDQTDTCTPSTAGISLQVTTQGENYVRYSSTDVAGNAEAVKSIEVDIDKDTDGDGIYDNFDVCSGTKGFAAYQGCPVGDSNEVIMYIVDSAKTGECGCKGKVNFVTKEFRYGSGCSAARIAGDSGEYERNERGNYQRDSKLSEKHGNDNLVCYDSGAYTIVEVHSAALQNSGVLINRMKVNGRDISNFVYNGTDPAGLSVWYTKVPKLNAKDRIKVHILANRPSTSTCRPATTCQESVDNAEVRVFDRRSAAFIAVWGNNPSPTRYGEIFDRAESSLCNKDTRGLCQGRGKINYSAIFGSTAGLIGSCITDETGTCVAGENSTGYYLVIAKFTDDDTNKTIYMGRTKDPDDFKDTNGDKIKDLAYRDFYVTKTIQKNKPISYSSCGKITITGSLLEVIKPDYTIWTNTEELYPFIFKSDSNWSVDICMYVPEGYSVSSVLDGEGNEIVGATCTQAFIENETKTVLFTLKETGSPEPNMKANLTLVNPHGVASVVALDIPGQRVSAPFDAMLAALIIGTVIIVAIVIGLIMMRGPRRR